MDADMKNWFILNI